MRGFKYVIVALMLPVLAVHAQKVKYKELYPLLDSRQYELAIPLLKAFLVDPKHTDHPSANFQLAMYYENMTLKQDVLKETEVMDAFADSAVTSYQKTRTLLTEKEVTKKNPEYYLSYQRRDVRTGKVGVKLSDIQYDIEKKISSLNDRKVAVNNLKISFQMADSLYKACQDIFKVLRQTYTTEKELYLQGDEAVITKLDMLIQLHEHAVTYANDMKTKLGSIEKSGYDPKLVVLELKDFEAEGITEADFLADEVKIWEYAAWSKIVKNLINDEVKPLHDEIIAYDGNLENLRTSALSDSISITDKIVDYGLIQKALDKYDPDPLPLKIFDAKKAELVYLSTLMEHKDHKDSLDLMLAKRNLEETVAMLSNYDSLLNMLIGFPYKLEATNYSKYVQSVFDGVDGLDQYIATKKAMAEKELDAYKIQLERIKDRANWLIDESDSIPLFKVDHTVTSNKYLPVIIEPTFTAGLYAEVGQPMKGYFSLVSQDGKPQSKVYFGVNDEFFSRNNISDVQALVDTDESGQMYHLMFYIPMAEQESVMSNLCKIYVADGLAWEKNLVLDASPTTMTVQNGTGDVNISYDLESYSGEKDLTSGLRIDKKGNVAN